MYHEQSEISVDPCRLSCIFATSLSRREWRPLTHNEGLGTTKAKFAIANRWGQET